MTYAKKHLGQNFLIDPNIRDRIIASCEIGPSDNVLEVGPGRGALTSAIAANAKHVYAVETDQEMIEHLRMNLRPKNISLIHADILRFPFHDLPARMKVIANLPYNIAAPVIEKIIIERKRFIAMFLTVQLEFGKRLLARPNCKDYGSLSCFVQYYTNGKILFKIKNTCFRPKPKVQSCFLKLEIPKKPKYPCLDEQFLFRVIRLAFSQRRKKVQNTLDELIPKGELTQVLNDLRIDPGARAEHVSLRQYVQLTNALKERI